jgi:hemerythrin-like domain-containing protein
MTLISEAIKTDHREIEDYYNKIINASNPDEQTRWQNQFTWELARHSVGEELVVYPAFEKHLGQEGKSMADKDREEHQSVYFPDSHSQISESVSSNRYMQQVKEQLKRFQNMKPGDSEFISVIRNLMSELSKHIKDEEENDLPKLEKALQQGESEKMANSFGRTKAFVPSRSHPSAPSKPPFETVVGLMTAPIDHLADLFRKFPEETASPNPSTK